MFFQSARAGAAEAERSGEPAGESAVIGGAGDGAEAEGGGDGAGAGAAHTDLPARLQPAPGPVILRADAEQQARAGGAAQGGTATQDGATQEKKRKNRSVSLKSNVN